MILLLRSYAEILSKLDGDEEIKYITKTIKLIKKESVLFEQRYIDTIQTIKKLRDIKSKKLNGDKHLPYI